ncbi:hypothetical protein MMC15_006921 [Xylographa vitiligo]|nr:hypothetical protein [Xylographa vitiligo]
MPSNAEGAEVKTTDDPKTMIKTWRPAAFLHADPANPPPPYAVIILNQPIDNPGLFVQICKNASLVVAADGGLNRLRHLSRQHDIALVRDVPICPPTQPLITKQIPHAVCGDMDSVHPDVLEHYSNLGTKVYRDPDQYSTDLTKCLRHLSSPEWKQYTFRHWDRYQTLARKAKQHEVSKQSSVSLDDTLDVLVVGSLGGRADQAFSLIHHLYAVDEDPQIQCGDVYLLTPESVIFLLRKGRNRIHTPVAKSQLGENVGIIPVSKPAVISTQGLEWDVQEWRTEFGKQVSTSNHVRREEVEVTTTERVLFTVDLGCIE